MYAGELLFFLIALLGGYALSFGVVGGSLSVLGPSRGRPVLVAVPHFDRSAAGVHHDDADTGLSGSGT